MSTTGYNARRAEFADLHYQQMARPGQRFRLGRQSMLPTGIQLGLGVRPAAVTVMPGQGSLDATGGDLDLAIDGNGYLEVTLPNGPSGLYPRRGAETFAGWADRNIGRQSGRAGHHHPARCARLDDQPYG